MREACRRLRPPHAARTVLRVSVILVERGRLSSTCSVRLMAWVSVADRSVTAG